MDALAGDAAHGQVHGEGEGGGVEAVLGPPEVPGGEVVHLVADEDVERERDGVADVPEAQHVEEAGALRVGELDEALGGGALPAPGPHGLGEQGAAQQGADAGRVEAVGEVLVGEEVAHVQAAEGAAVEREADRQGGHPHLGALEDAHRPPGEAQVEDAVEVGGDLPEGLPAREGEAPPVRPDLLLQESGEGRNPAGEEGLPALDAAQGVGLSLPGVADPGPGHRSSPGAKRAPKKECRGPGGKSFYLIFGLVPAQGGGMKPPGNQGVTGGKHAPSMVRWLAVRPAR